MSALTTMRHPVTTMRQRWRDPVLVVGGLLIVADLAWRLFVAWDGFLAVDDFNLTQQALRSGPGGHLLLTQYSNHLQPGGWLIYWAVTKAWGLAYWPYVVLMLIGQLVADVIFFRLARRMFAGWVPVLVLAIVALSPITLVATTWVPAAIYLVPLEIAVAWALSAQERYLATRSPRHLVSLGLAYGFGLFFYEKVVLVAGLVALVTLCLYASGGPIASIRQALRRSWPSFVVLAAITVPYLAIYLATSPPGNTLTRPGSTGVLVTYLGQILGENLVAGLAGGPVVFIATGQGTALVGTPLPVTIVSLVVLVALIAVTIARRPAAGRAWLLLGLYTIVPVGTVAVTRLNVSLGDLLGLLPHYVYDVVAVAAIAIGAAVGGVRGQATPTRPLPPWLTARPTATTVGALVGVAALVATVLSGVSYRHALADNAAHTWLRTVDAQLRAVPADARFVELYVPQSVVWGTRPLEYRRQSTFFATDKGPQPTFATEGEHLLVLDDDGYPRPATVTGRAAPPGPTDCGWPVAGTTRIALTGDPATSAWAVSLSYTATADTTATLALGAVTRDFPVRAGRHDELVVIADLWGTWADGGDHLDLSLADPAADPLVGLCVSAAVVGEIGPAA